MRFQKMLLNSEFEIQSAGWLCANTFFFFVILLPKEKSLHLVKNPVEYPIRRMFFFFFANGTLFFCPLYGLNPLESTQSAGREVLRTRSYRNQSSPCLPNISYSTETFLTLWISKIFPFEN